MAGVFARERPSQAGPSGQTGLLSAAPRGGTDVAAALLPKAMHPDEILAVGGVDALGTELLALEAKSATSMPKDGRPDRFCLRSGTL